MNLGLLVSATERLMPGRLHGRPLVATLPTGKLNATTHRVRGTNEVVIFLQRGLMGFLYHFSIAVACVIPTNWIKSERPLPAAELGNPGDAAHIKYAVRYLAKLIDAYILRGNPYLLSDPNLRGQAGYNQSMIAASMRKFPICHELMHLVYGHVGSDKTSLTKSQAWDREFLADLAGATIVASLRNAIDPGSAKASIWACCVALTGFEILEGCVAYLNTGSEKVPESATHPPPLLRRQELRRAMYTRLIGDGHFRNAAALLKLFRKGDAAIHDLWKQTRPYLDEWQRAGVKPSPIWRQREVEES